ARDLLHHRLGGFARGEALGIGGEHGQLVAPAFRQARGEAALELTRELAEIARVGGALFVPRLLELAAALDGAAKMRERRVGDVERRLLGPAEVVLGLLHLVDAERAAVRV